MLQLDELYEHRMFSYENDELYKSKVKKWHDKRIQRKKFHVGRKALLFNSMLKLFPVKHKWKWSRPFIISKVYLYGVVDLIEERGREFKVGKSSSRPFSSRPFNLRLEFKIL